MDRKEIHRWLFFAVCFFSVCFCVDGQTILAQDGSPQKLRDDWVQSYDAGYVDSGGAFAGGSEIMHLVSHKGKVYAANGYWMDWHWEIPPDHLRQSAQVLRLDATDAQWQVDLDTGKTNGYQLGYMKGNILKSVIFTADHAGNKLAKPVNLLVMAAGARFERGGAVSAWVRDDSSSRWQHTLVRHGPSSGGVRWVPRDMQVYRDKVTGAEKIFLLLGNPGVITGSYDPAIPSRIRWSRNTEFPFLEQGSFRSRPLGMVEANGSLFFSVDDAIYQRIDGIQPTWKKVIQLGEDVDTDVGGVRGLTAINNPGRAGESLLFVWAPGNQSKCEVVRLDPTRNGGFQRTTEVVLRDLMSKKIGRRVGYTLAAHNMMYPVVHPGSAETVHLIGLQGNIQGNDSLRWPGSRLYGGALYAVRNAQGTYSIQEVNHQFQPGSRPLVSARCFCLSPFGDQRLFVGGHDSSNRISSDLAWISHVPVEVALGIRQGKMSPWKKRAANVPVRLTQGPVYELRTYVAAENRMQHLLTRFRDHTNQIFKKHNIQALGYWVPIEGPPIQKRKLIYLLKHPSRYDAWKNWVHFSNDPQWKAVLDRPQFQRLLIKTPESVFLNEVSFAKLVTPAQAKAERVFELRTYQAADGKLDQFAAKFSRQTELSLKPHPMTFLGAWTPFDPPESRNTFLALLCYGDRQEADRNREQRSRDPRWQEMESTSGEEKLLLAKPESLLLRPTDFSALK